MDKLFQDIHILIDKPNQFELVKVIRQVKFDSLIKNDNYVEIRYFDYSARSNDWNIKTIYTIKIEPYMKITIE